MTTAHRPTWKAAVGRAQEGGWSAGGALSTATSVLDAPAHTKLKVRAGDQAVDRRAALAESLRKLEEVDRKAGALVRAGALGRRDVDPKVEEESRKRLLEQTADVDEEKLLAKYDDADDDFGNKPDDGGGGGWSDVDDDDGGGAAAAPGNAADESGSDLDASDTDSDEDESDDEDEEAALQAELAKIRAEREEARAREEAEEKAREDARMEEAALMGNPLLAGDSGATSSSSGRVKRRWNDDVVFRNQARGEPDQNKKRFINDTVRNDFHKRFLNKFVR